MEIKDYCTIFGFGKDASTIVGRSGDGEVTPVVTLVPMTREM